MVTPAAPVALVGVVFGLVLTGKPLSAIDLGRSALPRTSAFFAEADIRGAGAYGHFRPEAEVLSHYSLGYRGAGTGRKQDAVRAPARQAVRLMKASSSTMVEPKYGTGR